MEALNCIAAHFHWKYWKIVKKYATERAGEITVLLACSFDVDLGRIDYPE